MCKWDIDRRRPLGRGQCAVRAQRVGRRIEKTLEQPASALVGIVAVFLDGVGVILLPLPVLFDGFAGW